jgi:hypothetical protein
MFSGRSKQYIFVRHNLQYTKRLMWSCSDSWWMLSGLTLQGIARGNRSSIIALGRGASLLRSAARAALIPKHEHHFVAQSTTSASQLRRLPLKPMPLLSVSSAPSCRVGVELPDLPGLEESHLKAEPFNLKLGPRIRLMRYIEAHPPGGQDHTSNLLAPPRSRVKRRSSLLVRDRKLTSAQFMHVWNYYTSQGGNSDRIEG